ncbi:MAG: PDZ domain-containing protein [Gemmatimonadetes bacterium]|nr:PDZ domain-containing protein [Gemmatimonadota bacterium]
MNKLIYKYLVLSTLIMLLCLQLGLVVWTLVRYAQIEHWSPGIRFFGNEMIQTKGLTKSTVTNLQEGTWFHLVKVRNDGGISVTQVVPNSPADRAGLQPGDIIVSVNDVDLGSHPEAYFQERLRSRPGDELRLAWRRNDVLHSGTLTLANQEEVRYVLEVNGQEIAMSAGAMTWFQRGPFLVIPIILLCFGTWMGFRGPHNTVAFHCALLFLSMALSSTHAFHPMIAGWPDWILSVSIFVVTSASVLEAMLIIYVLSVFPNASKFGLWLKKRTWIVLSLLLVSTVCSLVYLYTLTYGWDNGLVLFVSEIVETIPEPTHPLIILILTACLLVAQRSVGSRQDRMRLRIIEAGFLSALVLVPLWITTKPGTLMASWGFLPLQGPLLPLIVWGLDSIVRLVLQCVLPLAFAYAIVAHRVFGLNFIFGRSLRYVLNNQLANLILCFGMFVVLCVTISTLPSGMVISDVLIACIAAGLTLILIGGWIWIKQPVLQFMDRYFFSRDLKNKHRLFTLGRSLSHPRDRDELFSRIGQELLAGLDLSYAAIYVVNGTPASMSVSWYGHHEVPGQVRVPIASQIEMATTKVECALRNLPSPNSLIEIDASKTDDCVKESGFELFTVIHGDAGRLGCIALGPKHSGEPFSSDEKERLLVLTAEAELALKYVEMAASLKQHAQGLRRLSRRLFDVQESERCRLARDLHDDTGQTLTALKVNLDLTRREFVGVSDYAEECLRDAVMLADETMEKLKSIAHELRPPTLDTVGLNEALEAQCESFGQRTRISVLYRGIDVPDLPDPISTCLYRILQEGLTNCIKHGEATSVDVELKREGRYLNLSIRDNGYGFDPKTMLVNQNNGGTGLIGMRERLESLQGHLEIESVPGSGTRLIASIPGGRMNDKHRRCR